MSKIYIILLTVFFYANVYSQQALFLLMGIMAGYMAIIR